MVQKVWYTYDEIHRVMKKIAMDIQQSGIRYDAMIAIGGGGFIPARILRTFLNIPIYVVTTSYYLSETEGKTAEMVKKVQWLNPIPEHLYHQNILVVDEVDDSRKTMEFVLSELHRDGLTQLGLAVIHNKRKEKVGRLPENIPYFYGLSVEDIWINYPWDAIDIAEHNQYAAQ